MQFKKKSFLAATSLVVAGIVVGSWITAKTQSFPFSYAQVPAAAQANPQVSFETGFGSVVQKVTPAVVSITSTTVRANTNRNVPDFNLPNGPFGDLFRQFPNPGWGVDSVVSRKNIRCLTMLEEPHQPGFQPFRERSGKHGGVAHGIGSEENEGTSRLQNSEYLTELTLWIMEVFEDHVGGDQIE